MAPWESCWAEVESSRLPEETYWAAVFTSLTILFRYCTISARAEARMPISSPRFMFRETVRSP